MDKQKGQKVFTENSRKPARVTSSLREAQTGCRVSEGQTPRLLPSGPTLISQCHLAWSTGGMCILAESWNKSDSGLLRRHATKGWHTSMTTWRCMEGRMRNPSPPEPSLRCWGTRPAMRHCGPGSQIPGQALVLQRQTEKAWSLLCGSSNTVMMMTIIAAGTRLSGAAAVLGHYLSMHSLVDTLTGFTCTNACSKSRVGAINLITFISPMSFPCGSAAMNLPAMPETSVQPLGWEDPLEKRKGAHSTILA